MNPRRTWRWLIAVALSIAGCRDGATAAGASERATPPAPAVVGYEPARWRLAPFEEINRTVLWVSHIVVRHRDAIADDVGFRAPNWRPDPPAPERSAADALARAQMIADRAAREPWRFAELAREYSDDVVTHERGGSLGGVRAGQLPPEYRDALAVLKPGQTSAVIQTVFGFHVLMRRPAPVDQQVAGRRIVVRYEGTLGGPPDAVVTRSREAALKRAREIATEIAASAARATDPAAMTEVALSSFAARAARDSDHHDAAQQGDLGVYALRDPEFLPREIERLGELRIGEVSEPLDSVFGWELLQRTPVTDRPRYAMEMVGLQVMPQAPDDSEYARANVRRRAEQLAGELARDPARFDALRQQYCCDGAQQWSAGRGPIGVAPVLDAIEIGAIARKPIETMGFFVIPRRVDPASVPALPKVRYELPSPDGPDFQTLVRFGDPTALALATRMFADEAVRALGLTDEAAVRVQRPIGTLADSFEKFVDDPKARVRAMDTALAELRSTLGASGFERFEAALNAWGSRLILHGTATPIAPARPPSR